MKNQQQVEKEEQQRIKNLVLNYDLQQSDEPECKYHNLADADNSDKLQRASGQARSITTALSAWVRTRASESGNYN